MYKKTIFTLLFIKLLTVTGMAYINDGLYLSTYMGASKSANNTLFFKFQDQDDLTYNARYDNKSFSDSHWWMAKLERWKNKKSVSIELIHHKIYLKNTNDIINNFSISDGYNLLYFNRGKQINNHILRYGAGIVIAHPDITITGRDRFKTKGIKGLFLSGLSIKTDHEYILYKHKTAVITLQTKLTASYAKIPISTNKNEYVIAPDYAIHISIGYVRLLPKKAKLKEKILFLTPLAYPKLVGTYILHTEFYPN